MEYGLLGEKLGHSFSKEIHSLIGDYDYRMYETDKSGAVSLMKEKNFKALNVTIPYKETVMPYLDFISDEAQAIGSVNTVVNRGGVLYGYNTDFCGLKSLIERAGITVEDKKVLILGTGGTSKTAYAVCKSLNASAVIKVSRHPSDSAVSYEEAERNHSDAAVIINATPVGMYPNNENRPVDIDCFPCLEGVADVIYNPLKTRLLSDAQAKGIKTTNGLYMLVKQAVRASEYFFDTEYDSELTERIYKKVLADKENITLVGMPSCGKSTIGKLLAEKTGREFIDTDSVIVERYGDISELFSRKGEKFFRDKETEIIAEVSKKTGAVISTGGGAVLREENIRLLKQNSRVYFLDRPLDLLCPTDDRPLAGSREKIEKLYKERYGIYESVCDEKIAVENDPSVPEKEIERRHFG